MTNYFYEARRRVETIGIIRRIYPGLEFWSRQEVLPFLIHNSRKQSAKI